MRQELNEKDIFNQVRAYAFDYVDQSFDRQVYPTQQAIDNLKIFEEALPDQVGDPKSILELLHTFGSPATVSQIGGRYFGLVNGGIIPTALATKWLNDFWDQNTPLYVTSPVTSRLETILEQWLMELFKLPGETVAAIGRCGGGISLAQGRENLRVDAVDVVGCKIHGKPSVQNLK